MIKNTLGLAGFACKFCQTFKCKIIPPQKRGDNISWFISLARITVTSKPDKDVSTDQ